MIQPNLLSSSEKSILSGNAWEMVETAILDHELIASAVEEARTLFNEDGRAIGGYRDGVAIGGLTPSELEAGDFPSTSKLITQLEYLSGMGHGHAQFNFYTTDSSLPLHHDAGMFQPMRTASLGLTGKGLISIPADPLLGLKDMAELTQNPGDVVWLDPVRYLSSYTTRQHEVTNIGADQRIALLVTFR